MLRFVAGLLSCVVVSVGGACASAPQTSADGRPLPTVAVVDDLEGRRAAVNEFADALKVSALRAHALRALGRLERLDAAPAILAALSDADPEVRDAAAFAAGQLDLAIGEGVSAHEAIATDVEANLAARLQLEQVATVRATVVRALGRVARTAGRTSLATLARADGPLRAAALQALAISFQRRPGSASDDVIAAIDQGLAANAADVKTAAAYLAFRLGTGLNSEQLAAFKGATEQGRIHLTRALASTKTTSAVVDTAVAGLLDDPDWRVRVEALRAVQSHADASIEPVLRALPLMVNRVAEPGAAHVVTAACNALSSVGAPSASLPVVEAAVSALPRGPTWSQARCGCAGVVEVLGGPANALDDCVASMSPLQQRLLGVQTVGLLRVSSIERTAALKGFINDEEQPKVRIAAAHVLCADGNVAAVDAAAARLVKETDTGVQSALLECFADGKNDDIIKDRTLGVVAERASGGQGFEQLEPLIAVADIASRRTTAGARALTQQLAQHADPRVKDAAKGILGGDRAPGPRAKIIAVPPVASLPLAIILHTPRGEIVVGLDREHSPRAVATFVALAKAGVVDGTPFHRVIADFVAQGGDPRGDGSGGPGYTIADEPSDVPFVRGVVGIAHAGKDTGGSQFFLVHSDQPHLDGRYTVLGTVVDGLAAMDALQPDDVLLSVEVTTALRPRR